MIETKKIYLTKGISIGYIYDLLSFGYVITDKNKEKVDKKKIKYYKLSRDTEMPNYSDICDLENEYEEIRKELTPYPKINPLTAFFACCLIFPLFLYYPDMALKMKAVDVKNEPFYLKMKEKMDEASKLMEEKPL